MKVLCRCIFASRAVEGVRVWAEPIGRNPHATWFLCVFLSGFLSSSSSLFSSISF